MMFRRNKMCLANIPRWPSILRTLVWFWGVGLMLCGGSGCQQKMANQARLDPLESHPFFEDQKASRDPVVGTVSRGERANEIVSESRHLVSGMLGGEVADTLPPEVLEMGSLREILLRGKERFGIYCMHCHDALGTGNGVVPQRGFPDPPTYHSPRLRDVPLGHVFLVITEGKGQMPPHGNLVPPRDRWAIAAYIRALQFSQHAPIERLPEAMRKQVQTQTGAEGPDS